MKVKHTSAKNLISLIGVDKLIIGLLMLTTIIVGGVLASIRVKAETTLKDQIIVSVPTACTMSGTIEPSEEHTRTVSPGIYTSGIGITNIKALCNDFDGFSIYAIGYTNDTDGITTMVGQNTGQTIITGTATSGDTSNWAMRLTAVSGTYQPTIDNSFNSYHSVPGEYTKVAHYTAQSGSSATDQSIGSNLQTTYAAFVAPAQDADTYVGKVKYLLVHPASIDSISSEAITAEFQAYPGTSISFPDGSTTNKISFRKICKPSDDNRWQFNTIIDGVTSSLYYDVSGHIGDDNYSPYWFDYIAIDTSYGVPILSFWYHEATEPYEAGDGFVYLTEDLAIPEYGINYSAGWYFGNANNPTSFITALPPIISLEGGSDKDSSAFLSWLSSNATIIDSDYCHFMITDGEYKEPIGYKGAWVVPMPDGEGGYNLTTFPVENGADAWISFLEEEGGSAFLGMSIPVYAYPGNAILFDGNGATAGDMSHVATRFDSSDAYLLAPNFYKSGYGFAGWSTNSSATPFSSDTIYGPNETVNESNFSFDSNGNATLYAVWVQSTGNFQDFSCQDFNSGITALTDIRDSNAYTIVKSSGFCFMMENLRLDGSATLNSTNTNDPMISNLGSSKDNWCADQNSECIDQSTINTNNINIGGVNSLGESLIQLYNQSWFSSYNRKAQWYGYGNHYNWYATTAGNGNYDMTSGDVIGDICPAGWYLPSVDALSALNYLVNSGRTDSSTGLRAYPVNLVYSGLWMYEGTEYRNQTGVYWSSTANNLDGADILDFTNDSVNVGNAYLQKYHGASIRCIQAYN